MKSFLKKFLLALLAIVLFTIFLFGHKDREVSELKDKYALTPSAFIKVDGMDVHYRDEGNINDSIPIVLIHGTGSSLHTYNAWTDELKKNRRVIRMDIPAFGLTGPYIHKKTYSIKNYVAFVEQFLKKIGVKKCDIAGNSLGGNIAWNYTVKNPQNIHKLILIDATGYPVEAESRPLGFTLGSLPYLNSFFGYITPKFVIKNSLENVYADKSKITDELIDRYFELTLRKGNRQAFCDRMAAESENLNIDAIKNIAQPTLILWGDQDKLSPLKNAYLFQKDIRNNKLVILKNTGHLPMEENPTESLEVLMNFLNE